MRRKEERKKEKKERKKEREKEKERKKSQELRINFFGGGLKTTISVKNH